MYKPRYIQYVNLPVVPEDIIADLPTDLSAYETQKAENYHWTDSHNARLNAWAQKNICNEMYFAFQWMTGDLPIHKDLDTKTKFVYIIAPGGANVATKFWDNKYNLLDQYVIEKNQWHILKADTYHSVEGIESGKMRWSITAKIF